MNTRTDLLAVQGTLKSLLQHHSSKASILQPSAFLTFQLSHPYVTTGKTIHSLVMYTYILFIHKKKLSNNINYNMGEPNTMVAEINET